MPRKSWRGMSVVMITLTAMFAPASASAHGNPPPDKTLATTTRFSVPFPDRGALRQAVDLLRHHHLKDAALIAKMVTTPQAVWITKGTPSEARQQVRNAVVLADAQRAVAVLVAYNIPGRDCANLSAGGATTQADYQAWIDGFASGIGSHKVVVVLEPDGLGLLPGSDCGGPTDTYPYTDAERYAELNYAVDKLEGLPGALVYLDGTHSGWLNVHDISTRLMQAGVDDTEGFFLNLSNFQFTQNQLQYGTWVSKCIARLTANVAAECPDQYWNGGPHPAMIADLLGEWTGVALSKYGVWSDTATTPELNASGVNLRYADTTGEKHFIVDTSRNGLGPWQYPSTYASDAAALDWCNPPGRGLGVRPTVNIGNTLVDAYVWVKTPGQSDGTCNRNGSAVGTPDPEWNGIVDPAAGEWFLQQALQLAQLANPPLIG
jgi:endoglucanase